jgi:2,4-dienoyl-CoA reductase-like NADH-dependent reductase (Old Yellow Enzyme family)/thioredoxin reductase
MELKFERLLSPGKIGVMNLKNRIVMPPMERSFATPEGYITRQMIDHYAARAKGGVGLVIVEATYIHPTGKGAHQEPGIHDDRCIPGLYNLAEAIKAWGSKAAIQLHHPGSLANPAITGMQLVSSSAIPIPGGAMPRELSLAECAELVEAFAQAARRAKIAGFDAIEIQAGHGKLINQFLSARSNHRTDKYGGDLSGRMTFLLEIIRRVREVVGNRFSITLRINGAENTKGGITIEDSKEIASKIQHEGVDAIHVSLSTPEDRFDPQATRTNGTMFSPRGHLVHLAEQIKSTVSIPVITVGSISPEMGEDILRQGKADFIAIGRALLADPDLPNKLAAGKAGDIRPCIRCNELCLPRWDLGIRCAVNAECGFESYPMLSVTKPKKVLIIGGGPSGMECARIATLRGHEVTIYEKTGQLGGHLIEAAVPDFKEDLKNFRDWLVRQIKQMGISVKLNKEATPQLIATMKPDVIVVATGSVPLRPNIPGINNPNVVTAIDVLLGKASPGNVNIMAGGGAVGCEAALYLAQQGKQVTIVEMLPEVATDCMPTRGILMLLMKEAGVGIRTNLKITKMDKEGITALGQDQGTVKIPGDKVLLAMGMASQAEIYAQLRDKASEVYLIGDAATPARVGEAVRNGYRIGNSI